MSTITFKIADGAVLDIPAGDAAQLGLHLAVFGSDEEMPRSRRLAEKIAVAVSLAGRGDEALISLPDSLKTDVSEALDAMIDDRAGNLPDSLLALRTACRQ